MNQKRKEKKERKKEERKKIQTDRKKKKTKAFVPAHSLSDLLCFTIR